MFFAEPYTSYLQKLDGKLRPMYEVSNAEGHDNRHVDGMLRLGPQIRNHLTFNVAEFHAAVWLHNLDRFLPAGGRPVFEAACVGLLADSPFQPEGRERILTAVLRHSTLFKDDDRSDLQKALQIADMVEKLAGPWAIVVGAVFSGQRFPLCNPASPFEYGNTDNPQRNVLTNYWRHFEWYAMIPRWARALVPLEHRLLSLMFIRQLGQKIAQDHGIENKIEDCLRKALGPTFDEFCRPSIGIRL